MRKLVTGLTWAIGAAGVGATAVVAVASPGGTLVAIDDAEGPDVVIQELRTDNADATHVPVKVRVSVPPEYAEEGRAMRWASITAYLTKTTDPADDPLTEEIIKLGAQWSDRSVTVEVPSPGEGNYFVHVKAELSFDDRTEDQLTTTSTQPVIFGSPEDCGDVNEVDIGGSTSACPLLFATKSSDLTPRNNGRLRAKNDRVLEAITAQIDALCAKGELHRVSVRGWASPLHSVNPTNEELAQSRADAAWRELRKRVSGCKDRIYNDSEPGLQAVTKQFGSRYSDNQCVQVRINSHSCSQ